MAELVLVFKKLICSLKVSHFYNMSWSDPSTTPSLQLPVMLTDCLSPNFSSFFLSVLITLQSIFSALVHMGVEPFNGT